MCPILYVRAAINVRILLSPLWDAREEFLSEWSATRKQPTLPRDNGKWWHVCLLQLCRVNRRSCWRGYYLETAAAEEEGSLERRHHFNSWLISVISMPGMTMNLQDCISRGSSSSGNWQVTRQY